VIYTDENTIDVRKIFFPALTICPGLIVERGYQSVIKYDEIAKELRSGRITTANLTEHESVSLFFFIMNFSFRFQG
jgi:hypothetical protein